MSEMEIFQSRGMPRRGRGGPLFPAFFSYELFSYTGILSLLFLSLIEFSLGDISWISLQT